MKVAHEGDRPVRGPSSGAPASFRWHGVQRAIDEVRATRQVRDRWWAPPTEEDVRTAEGDHMYARVRCPHHQVFELFATP